MWFREHVAEVSREQLQAEFLFACGSGPTVLLEAILDSRVDDIDFTSGGAKPTGLQSACAGERAEHVRMLLRQPRAAATINDRFEKVSALDAAIISGDAEAVRALLEHEEPRANVDDTSLRGACIVYMQRVSATHPSEEEECEEGDDDDDDETENESTSSLEIVRLLLELRPELSVSATAGLQENTLLHTVCQVGNSSSLDLVRLLLELRGRDLDPNQRNRDGKTPFDYLDESDSFFAPEIARILRSGAFSPLPAEK